MSATGGSESDSDSPTRPPDLNPGWGPPSEGLGDTSQQHAWRDVITQGDSLEHDMGDNFRIVTLNLHGGLDTKMEPLCAWMRDMSIDVLCLQEHHCNNERRLRGLRATLRGNFGLYGAVVPDSCYGGAAIMLSKRWMTSVQGVHTSADGRTIAVDVLTRRCRQIRLVSTYGPSGPRSKPARELDQYVNGLREVLLPFRQQHPDSRIFVGGDFNMIERYDLDRTDSVRPLRPPMGYENDLIQLLDEAALVDAFRRRHPRLRTYTHSSVHHGRVTASRLDRLYVDDTPGLAVASHVSSYVVNTDHLPVVVDVRHSAHFGSSPHQCHKPPKRDPRPRLTDVRLTDQRWDHFGTLTNLEVRGDGRRRDETAAAMLDRINDVLFENALHVFPPTDERRPDLSEEDQHIRTLHFTVTLLRRVVSLHRHDWNQQTTRESMRRTCRRLDREGVITLEMDANGLTADSHGRTRTLLEMREVELQRALRRRNSDRIKKISDEREDLFKSGQTSRWFRRVALRQMTPIDTRSVRTIRDGIHSFTSSPAEVKQTIQQRFHAISARTTTPPTPEAQAWGDRTYVGTPTNDGLRPVLEPITAPELDEAIARLPTGKAAGPDGVTAELYKHAHPSVREALLMAFNEVLVGAPLPKSWAHGLVYPVPKADGSSAVENSRPISLLSTQRKLFERIVCDRLTSRLVALDLLHESQFGFTPNRSTYAPIFFLNAALEQARDTNCPIFGVLFDVSKAFDTVPESGLRQSMDLLGFPPELSRLLLSINGQATAQVITAHGLTDSYEVERGVRQGSILSPLLWRIFMDPLLKEWHTQSDPYVIRDGQGNGCRLFGQAYADDAAGFSSTLAGIRARILTMSLFCSYHGIKLNLDKSELFSNCDLEDVAETERLTVLGPHTPFRYLGVYFTLNLNWMHQEIQVETKLRRLAEELRARRLTYAETAILYKMVVVPIVAYVCSLAGVSEAFLRRWDNVFGRILLNKRSIGQGTTRAVLYGGEKTLGLRIPSLVDIRRIQHVSEVLVCLNTPGPLSQAASIMVSRLQFYWGLHDMPFSFAPAKGMKLNTLMARVWTYLATLGAKVAAPGWRHSFKPKDDGPASVLLRQLLPPSTPPVVWREMAAARRFFLEDVLDADRRFIAYVGNRGRTPRWYRAVVKACANDPRTRRVRADLPRPVPTYGPLVLEEAVPLVDSEELPALRVFATDGALVLGDEATGRAAISVCEFREGLCVAQHARRLTHSFLSSTDVEIRAVIEAIRLTPPNCPMRVYTDSQAAIDRLTALAQGPPPTLRQWLYFPSRASMVEFGRLFVRRTAPIQLLHVKAHGLDRQPPPLQFITPEQMNWMADRVARDALNGPPPSAVKVATEELPFVLTVNGVPWPHSPRAALQALARTIWDECWMTKRRMGALTRQYLSTSIHPTADVILFRRLSRKQWTGRAPFFLLKPWLNVLPTSSVLSFRDAEETGMCVFCGGQQRETNTHMLVGCPHWEETRSDLLWDLADRLAQLLGRRPESAEALIRASGMLDTLDVWFGLFPLRMLERLAPNMTRPERWSVEKRLFSYWTGDALPGLWRERCRQKKEHDAPEYTTRHPGRCRWTVSREAADLLEAECLDDNSAERTLHRVGATGLLDFTRNGTRRLPDYHPVRDCVRLDMAGLMGSLYVKHEHWEALAENSLARIGPTAWNIPLFHDCLLESRRAHLRLRQMEPWDAPLRWRLPSSLQLLIRATLGTDVHLFSSPFVSTLDTSMGFSEVPADVQLGFNVDSTSPAARAAMMGSSTLVHPPYEAELMRLAMVMAAEACSAQAPTRVVVVVPSWQTRQYDHVRQAEDLNAHVFLRIPPGRLRLEPPYHLGWGEWREHQHPPCPWPTDLYVFENRAASRDWCPARDLEERWSRWLEAYLAPPSHPAPLPHITRHRGWGV